MMQTFFMFMPWFFFKAGIFFRPASSISLIRKSAKRLMMPWLTFGLLSTPISFLLIYNRPHPFEEWIRSTCHDIFFNMAFPENLALWFLPSLLICRFLFNKLQGFNHISILAIPFIGFILALFFRVLPPDSISHQFVFPNIFLGLFFFASGNILKESQYSPYTLLIAVIVFAILTFFYPGSMDVRVNGGSGGNIAFYIFYYPRALCAILIINYLASLIPPQFLDKSILVYIGRNSMAFYVMHMPIMKMYKIITFHLPPISQDVALTIMLVILAISLPLLDILFRRYWPEALGLKRDRKSMTAPDELP